MKKLVDHAPESITVVRGSSVQMLNPISTRILEGIANVLLDSILEIWHLGIEEKRQWVMTDVEFQAGLHDAEARVSKLSILNLLIARHVDDAAAIIQKNAEC